MFFFPFFPPCKLIFKVESDETDEAEEFSFHIKIISSLVKQLGKSSVYNLDSDKRVFDVDNDYDDYQREW